MSEQVLYIENFILTHYQGIIFILNVSAFHNVNLDLQTIKHWTKTLPVSELMSLYL